MHKSKNKTLRIIRRSQSVPNHEGHLSALNIVSLNAFSDSDDPFAYLNATHDENKDTNINAQQPHTKPPPPKPGWYYVDGKGQIKGPISKQQLKHLYTSKQINGDHYIWNGTTIKQWTILRNIKILFHEIKTSIHTYTNNNIGYDIDIFMNVDTLHLEQYLCGICKSICRDCVELSCSSGHLFCEFCIKQYLQQNTSNAKQCICPVCDEYNDSLSYHCIQFVRKRILNLGIKCVHFQTNCLWRGKLQKLRYHLKYECKASPNSVLTKKEYYQQIQCVYCKEKISRKDLSSHIKNKCKERTVKCLYNKMGCLQSMKYKDLSSHLTECIVLHNELQLFYFDVIQNSNKYIFVSNAASIALNGLYERENELDFVEQHEDKHICMKPLYKKQGKAAIYIRFNIENSRWVFSHNKNNEDAQILLMQTHRNSTRSMNLSAVLFDDIKITLCGFNDLFLFRRLKLLECDEFIEIIGRKGTNVEMNGVYRKQNELHGGRVWYMKMKREHDKHHWVIRYLSVSQLWLLDRRGLKNDDIANAIGYGDVMSPVKITQWEIHNGKTFVLDKDVQIRKYCPK